MSDDRKRRAFAAVVDSAEDQAALAVAARPAAEANGKPAPPPAPPEDLESLVGDILSGAYQETSLYGFAVPDLPADQDREVHFTVRIPKKLRLAISMFCARYDLTAQDFAAHAFDLLMTVAERQRQAKE